jgi:hypothetical protein
LLLGAIFALTGSLVGPLLAHAIVNAANLTWLRDHDPAYRAATLVRDPSAGSAVRHRDGPKAARALFDWTDEPDMSRRWSISAMPTRSGVPTGRLLYRPSDVVGYVVVQHDRTGELRIVEDGWSSDSIAAGAFEPDEALRAFRLANTSVPHGCELGPWGPGITLFRREPLPGSLGDWSPLEPAWLSPSATRYSESDISQVVDETCCAPPQDAPRIDWSARADIATPELTALVRARHPDFVTGHVGALQRPWNVHPAGSPVYAPREDLSGGFVVVDLPPA